MKQQFLHLSVFACDNCQGPVISGSLAERENEISKETVIRQLGVTCLSCDHLQTNAAEGAFNRNFPPVEWPQHKLPDFREVLKKVVLDPVASA